jgi:hypothetical protein
MNNEKKKTKKQKNLKRNTPGLSPLHTSPTKEYKRVMPLFVIDSLHSFYVLF